MVACAVHDWVVVDFEVHPRGDTRKAEQKCLGCGLSRPVRQHLQWMTVPDLQRPALRKPSEARAVACDDHYWVVDDFEVHPRGRTRKAEERCLGCGLSRHVRQHLQWTTVLE